MQPGTFKIAIAAIFQNVQVSDTTGADSCNAVKYIKKLSFQNHPLQVKNFRINNGHGFAGNFKRFFTQIHAFCA